MLKNITDPKDVQRILLAILSTSGTLAGLSMALVGIVNLRVADTKTETIADDMFLFSSVGFLVVCFLIFFALRRLESKSMRYWTTLIDTMFLFSMTLLVLSGFVVLYAFGRGYFWTSRFWHDFSHLRKQGS
jgi:nitrate reductase gamma subunit